MLKLSPILKTEMEKRNPAVQHDNIVDATG